jgi:hypothetical protein
MALCAALLLVGCGRGNQTKLPTPEWAEGNPSLANDNNPRLRAHAEAGTLLQVFAQGYCQNEPLLVVSVEESGVAEFSLPVEDNSQTFLTLKVVRSEDSSPCSRVHTYVEDSLPPAPKPRESSSAASRSRTGGGLLLR